MYFPFNYSILFWSDLLTTICVYKCISRVPAIPINIEWKVAEFIENDLIACLWDRIQLKLLPVSLFNTTFITISGKRWGINTSFQWKLIFKACITFFNAMTLCILYRFVVNGGHYQRPWMLYRYMRVDSFNIICDVISLCKKSTIRKVF